MGETDPSNKIPDDDICSMDQILYISHYVSTAYLSFCSGDLDLRCLPIIKYLDMYFILRPQINNFEFKECVGSTIYYKYKIYKKLFISTKGYQTSSRVKVLTSIKFIFLMLYFN